MKERPSLGLSPLNSALFCLASLLTATPGCGGDSSTGGPEPSTSGSRSFWLKSCSTTADCDDEAACICSVCTDTCSLDAECSLDDVAGRCAGLIELGSRCGADVTERVCLPQAPPSSCSDPLTEDPSLGTGSVVDCPYPGALACEDFEGEFPESYATSWEGETVPIRRQSCVTADGEGALSLALTDNWGQLQMPLASEVSDGSLFVRLRAFIPEGVTLADYAVLFALRSETGSFEDQIELSLTGDGSMLLGAGELFETETNIFPQDQWLCVELELTVGDAGSAILRVDDNQVLEAPEAQTRPPSGPIHSAVALGAVRTGGSLFEIVVDDLVVARERIGCD